VAWTAFFLGARIVASAWRQLAGERVVEDKKTAQAGVGARGLLKSRGGGYAPDFARGV
jgi:hypothetical protein